MKFRQRPRADVKIDLTSLIDVVFLLLIFFMVSTTFKKYSQLNVELPSAASSKSVIGASIEIMVDAKGEYHFQDKPYGHDLVALKTAVQADVVNAADLQIAIVGDKLAPHQSIVFVMDLANQLGIHKLKIIAHST